jgi:hypothetical protein
MKLITPTVLKLITIFLSILTVYMSFYVFHHYETPVSVQELQNAQVPDTIRLSGGETLSQPFTASYNTLTDIAIALDTSQTTSTSASVLITLSQNGNTILEQPLSVSAFNNGELFTLSVNAQNCKGDPFILSITNASDAKDSAASFDVLTTAKPYLFLKNTQDCRLNGNRQSQRIICEYSYLNGTQYYKPLTYSFLVFLTGILLISFILHFPAILQRRTESL